MVRYRWSWCGSLERELLLVAHDYLLVIQNPHDRSALFSILKSIPSLNSQTTKCFDHYLHKDPSYFI